MLSYIWSVYLYQPIFNALIVIYNTIANENLGWAVVWLTVLLRIVLLPLTILSERNNLRHEQAMADSAEALKAYRNDPIAQKEVTRKIVKKYHLSPWAKVLTLAIQLLVLVLLYQVFLRGITGEKVAKILYSSVDFPGKINTVFYGFEIGRVHDMLWSGIAAVYLFVSILFEQRMRPAHEKPDIYYLVFFPLFTFAILWMLPMVKSLFILTTMIFSTIISLMRHLLFSKKPKKAEAAHGH